MKAEGVAWFILGEGTIGLGIQRKKRWITGFVISPYIIISNNEKELLSEVFEFLFKHHIHCRCIIENRYQKINTKNKPNYRMEIFGYKSCEQLLDLILPHLKGRKQRQGYLLLNFIKRFKRTTGGDPGKRANELDHEWQRLLTAVKYHDAIQKYSSQVRIKMCKYNFQQMNKLYQETIK